MEPVLGLLQPELGPPNNDLKAVVDVGLAQIVEPEGRRHLVDEDDIVDAEGLLQRRESIQLLQDRLRVDRRFDVDLDGQSVDVAQIGNALNADELAVVGQLPDLADNPLWSDEVRELGDDDRLAGPARLLDVCFGTDAERALTGFVGLS